MAKRLHYQTSFGKSGRQRSIDARMNAIGSEPSPGKLALFANGRGCWRCARGGFITDVRSELLYLSQSLNARVTISHGWLDDDRTACARGMLLLGDTG